ncbi:MAG: 4-phosphoerythronate dehydrogenase [Sedimentisphaerales bacterium]|nr:4-phosphoerythronate dehydrogenase [Sedimentisphaerales bacterium]
MRIVADANIPFVQECFSSIADVEVMSGRDMTPQAIAGADALLVRSITPVNEQLLAGSSVRFVGTATIGFDHVDLDYLAQHNIGFASAPGSNANSAAEYIIAALLGLGRLHGIRLEGKSIGVIGVGNVGSRVAAKCEALGMRVLRNDPPLARLARSLPVGAGPRARPGQPLGVAPTQSRQATPEYVPIEALYDCDFVTFHTPLTYEGIDKTYHQADEKFFASLKPGVVLLNASRGAVVDSTALKQAIAAGRLRAVALDVWENEPDIDVELLELVDLGSPHIAGYSLDGKIAGMIMIYEAVCRYFGLAPTHRAGDLLPAPAVPRLDLPSDARDDEAVLAEAVDAVYSIRADDLALRQIEAEPPPARGRFFDALRKNYRVRREFHNTTVVLDDPAGTLAAKLCGISFAVQGRDA